MSQMAFTFAAPNGVHYDAASVKQVDVPSFSGSFGILPNHVPALAVLKPGVVTVYEDGGEVKKFFVSSGSVTVNEDASVQILAEEAHSLDVVSQALSQAECMWGGARPMPAEGAGREAAAKEVTTAVKKHVGQQLGAWKKARGAAAAG